MGAKAKQMQEAGRKVVSFAAGEPDFATPAPIRRAAAEAIEAGKTKYTASAGTHELRQAIAAKFVRENGLTVGPENVMATCGAKQAVYNALYVLLDRGDEVLVPTPCWPTYLDQAASLEVVPVQVPTRAEDGYALDPSRLEDAVTPRTKALLLNSPCNPTGACLSDEALDEVAQVASRHGLWILSDEIYERLRYDGAHRSAALAYDPARTVTVSGCSKTYAMTGWRIGFACGPAEVVSAMASLQDQVTSNPTTFAQSGAVAALAMPAGEVEEFRATFRRRRDLMASLLEESLGEPVARPAGAFYILLDVQRWAGGAGGDEGLADRLLEEAGVATVPGSCFCAPGRLRLSYAASDADIGEGVAAMARFLLEAKA